MICETFFYAASTTAFFVSFAIFSPAYPPARVIKHPEHTAMYSCKWNAFVCICLRKFKFPCTGISSCVCHCVVANVRRHSFWNVSAFLCPLYLIPCHSPTCIIEATQTKKRRETFMLAFPVTGIYLHIHLFSIMHPHPGWLNERAIKKNGKYPSFF